MLRIQNSGAKSWAQRIVIHAKRRNIGLGAADLFSLADAKHPTARAAGTHIAAVLRWTALQRIPDLGRAGSPPAAAFTAPGPTTSSKASSMAWSTRTPPNAMNRRTERTPVARVPGDSVLATRVPDRQPAPATPAANQAGQPPTRTDTTHRTPAVSSLWFCVHDSRAFGMGSDIVVNARQ